VSAELRWFAQGINVPCSKGRVSCSPRSAPLATEMAPLESSRAHELSGMGLVGSFTFMNFRDILEVVGRRRGAIPESDFWAHTVEIPDKRDLSRTGTVVTNWAGTDTGASALDSKAGVPPVNTLIELTLGFSALKARSRKHPGLAKGQNRFHTMNDRRERHEHLLRVSSDKRATRLKHKATYTYATFSPHQKRVLVLFPPLSHPHHRATTAGGPYNRPCAISVT